MKPFTTLKLTSMLAMMAVLGACSSGGSKPGVVTGLPNLSGHDMTGSFDLSFDGNNVTIDGTTYSQIIENNNDFINMAKEVTGATTATASVDLDEATDGRLGAIFGTGTNQNAATATTVANADLLAKIETARVEFNTGVHTEWDEMGVDVEEAVEAGKLAVTIEGMTAFATGIGTSAAEEDLIFTAKDLADAGYEWDAVNGEWTIDGEAADIEGELSRLQGIYIWAHVIDETAAELLAAAGKPEVTTEREDTMGDLVLGKAGLKYSAFGIHTLGVITVIDNEDDGWDGETTLIASGRADHEINGDVMANWAGEELDPNESAVFTGRAVAFLNVDDEHGLFTGDATLSFGNTFATSTALNLMFDDWYGLDFEGADKTLFFEEGMTIREGFELTQSSVAFDGVQNVTGTLSAEFFGVEGTPDLEVVGTFTAQDSTNFDQEFFLQGAFGARFDEIVTTP